MKRITPFPRTPRTALQQACRAALLGATLAATCLTAPAQDTSISDDIVRLGILTDLGGPFADITGPGSAAAIQMAIDDFGGQVLGKKIELLVVDHQNKADIAANKAREWFDTGKVDAIMDVAVSAPALAVLEVAKQKQKVIVFNGPGTDRLTGDLCMPSTVHYVYDTYALANVTASAITQRGGKEWYFITADYAFGHSLQDQASAVVTAQGGKVLGAAKHPIAATDFASFMLSAQNSKAQVIGLANAGSDTVNTIKAAREFGLTQGKNKQTLAGLLMYINDIHAIGLRTAGGLMLTEAFYWDMNEETRAWSKRYFEKMKKMPNMSQAGAYSSTMHYLKAVQAARTDDTAKVMAQMKATPINDFFAKNGRIREDGRMVHDMYLFEVKSQADSKYPWDYYKLVATVPGDKAFLPLAQSKCPMIKK
ncbi:ABC transporter substrate-binding protein [Acidovorax sp. FHTAMBA]|jgi:branched-chain amino acid transport system substrate-binding protein|uniref:ABC transporter substrate-binding protein n=1 Tax=Acidovorax sp. FHTAMBA TaxID=3140252 RepID=UPI0015F4E168